MSKQEKYSEALKNLSDIQRRVTQEDATEPPFSNQFWDHHEEGIYVDIVSGEPLFSSTHKYDAGCGWPSFYQSISPKGIIEKDDFQLAVKRTEVRSSEADSHLGHVFADGPQEKTGLRYCINSASLRFVPKQELEQQGYGEFLYLFND